MKKALYTVALVLVISFSGAAWGQAVICGAPATCTNSAGVQTCTEQWAYTLSSGTIAGGYNNTLSSATGAATNCSVNGNINTRTFIAQQPTSITAAGGCNFAGNFDFGGATNSYECVIDDASGLPVELMEFSADDEHTGS